MEVLLVAAKKDLIDDYVQVITEAGLQPVAIDVASFAVENAYEANYDVGHDEVVALVNIGAQVVNINVVQGGVPSFTRDITTAGNQYTEEIQKTLSVGFEEAERLKLGARAGEESQDVVPQEVEKAMQAVTETVIGEISRSLDFYAATSAENRIMADIMKFGFPGHAMIRYREGYVLSYDGRHRVPLWVAERLNAERLEPKFKPGSMRFRVDLTIPEGARSPQQRAAGRGNFRTQQTHGLKKKSARRQKKR